MVYEVRVRPIKDGTKILVGKDVPRDTRKMVRYRYKGGGASPCTRKWRETVSRVTTVVLGLEWFQIHLVVEMDMRFLESH